MRYAERGSNVVARRARRQNGQNRLVALAALANTGRIRLPLEPSSSLLLRLLTCDEDDRLTVQLKSGVKARPSDREFCPGPWFAASHRGPTFGSAPKLQRD